MTDRLSISLCWLIVAATWLAGGSPLCVVAGAALVLIAERRRR